MADSVAIDTRDITITPVFRWENVEDINEGERVGHLVKKMIQVVEVRFAGSKNYSPVFPVDAFWQRQNGRVVTYGERWAEQYRAFLAGDAQEAAGTPLEMLKPYGISDNLLSLCRAWKIYSIEALDRIEGSDLKNLGMAANALKDMARVYLADRSKNQSSADEMAKLRAELEALKAERGVPLKEATLDEKNAAVTAADAEFEAMTDDGLKDWISARTGAGRPRGNPSRETLVGMARELSAA